MRRILATALTLAALGPAPAAAQAVWDAPSFMRAGAPAGLTLALTDSDPGDGLGGLALWRRGGAPTGIGFRAGIAEWPGDQVVGIFGLDVSRNLPELTEDSELQALWWTGAGVAVGDDLVASFPLGLVLSWNGEDEGVTFSPYAGGHVVLDVTTAGDDDIELDGVVDLGLDVAFPSGWVGRFGAALGGRESLAIGLRIPSGR